MLQTSFSDSVVILAQKTAKPVNKGGIYKFSTKRSAFFCRLTLSKSLPQYFQGISFMAKKPADYVKYGLPGP